MNKLPISAAKQVGDQFNLRQVVILGYDGERAFVTTWGRTKADCAKAAKAQDWWSGRIFLAAENADA